MKDIYHDEDHEQNCQSYHDSLQVNIILVTFLIYLLEFSTRMIPNFLEDVFKDTTTLNCSQSAFEIGSRLIENIVFDKKILFGKGGRTTTLYNNNERTVFRSWVRSRKITNICYDTEENCIQYWLPTWSENYGNSIAQQKEKLNNIQYAVISTKVEPDLITLMVIGFRQTTVSRRKYPRQTWTFETKLWSCVMVDGMYEGVSKTSWMWVGRLCGIQPSQWPLALIDGRSQSRSQNVTSGISFDHIMEWIASRGYCSLLGPKGMWNE